MRFPPDRLRFFLVGGLLLTIVPPSWAQSESRGLVTKSAPIMLVPDAARTPLRVAAAGTSLVVLRTDGDWFQVQFHDPQHGLRTGYVQRRFVVLQPAAEQPHTVSVPSSPAA